MRRTLALLACLASPTVVSAQTITLAFHTVAGGLGVSGSGTAAATVGFGTVSAYGPVSPGATRTNTATDFRMATQFGVRVTRSGGFTADYRLRARLTNPNALVWAINGVQMTTNFLNVANAQPYSSIVSHSLAFTVPLSRAPGALSARFNVRAIAN